MFKKACYLWKYDHNLGSFLPQEKRWWLSVFPYVARKGDVNFLLHFLIIILGIRYYITPGECSDIETYTNAKMSRKVPRALSQHAINCELCVKQNSNPRI